MDWPLFTGMQELDVRRVLEQTRRRRYARGAILCHEGEPADSFHLIAVGRLAVYVTTPDGETVTLNVLGPGDCFGELSLLQSGRAAVRTATIVALEAAESLVLSAAAFRELCQQDPRVEHVLTTLLARRVEELSARLLETVHVGLDRRLYRRLVALAELYRGPGDGPVTIALTQENLADLVGGTRPTVNQLLRNLAAQGILRLGRGRVVITDLDALSRMCA